MQRAPLFFSPPQRLPYFALTSGVYPEQNDCHSPPFCARIGNEEVCIHIPKKELCMKLCKKVLIFTGLCVLGVGSMRGAKDEQEKALIGQITTLETETEHARAEWQKALEKLVPKYYAALKDMTNVKAYYFHVAHELSTLLKQARAYLKAPATAREQAFDQVSGDFSYLEGTTVMQLDTDAFKKLWNTFKDKKVIEDPGVDGHYYTFTFNDDNTALVSKESKNKPANTTFDELSSFFELARKIVKTSGKVDEALKYAFDYFASLDLESAMLRCFDEDEVTKKYVALIDLRKKVEQLNIELINKKITLAMHHNDRALTAFVNAYQGEHPIDALSALNTVQEKLAKIAELTAQKYQLLNQRERADFFKNIINTMQEKSRVDTEKIKDNALYWKARIEKFLPNLRYSTLQLTSQYQPTDPAGSVHEFVEQIVADLKSKLSTPFTAAYLAIETAADKKGATQKAGQELDKFISMVKSIVPLMWQKYDTKAQKNKLDEIAQRGEKLEKKYQTDATLFFEVCWLRIEAAIIRFANAESVEKAMPAIEKELETIRARYQHEIEERSTRDTTPTTGDTAIKNFAEALKKLAEPKAYQHVDAVLKAGEQLRIALEKNSGVDAAKNSLGMAIETLKKSPAALEFIKQYPQVLSTAGIEAKKPTIDEIAEFQRLVRILTIIQDEHKLFAPEIMKTLATQAVVSKEMMAEINKKLEQAPAEHYWWNYAGKAYDSMKKAGWTFVSIDQ